MKDMGTYLDLTTILSLPTIHKSQLAARQTKCYLGIIVTHLTIKGLASSPSLIQRGRNHWCMEIKTACVADLSVITVLRNLFK